MIWEVTRRHNSEVEIRKSLDPPSGISPTPALAKTEEIPADLRSPLVTSFCRSALEANFHERIRALTAALAHDTVRFTWSELAGLVGGRPPSAQNHRAWWSGDRPHVRVWHKAGYTVADLDPGRSAVVAAVQKGLDLV